MRTSGKTETRGGQTRRMHKFHSRAQFFENCALAPVPGTLPRMIVKCGGNKNTSFPRAPQAVLAPTRDSAF
jgi:hypothetical protein